jgi:hypothetical protein
MASRLVSTLLPLLAVLLLPSAAARAATSPPSILVWAGDESDPAVQAGLVAAALQGTGRGPGSVVLVRTETDLCGNLTLALADLLIVPNVTSLPAGRYWGEGGPVSPPPSPPSPLPCVLSALPAFIDAGGSWVVAPGQMPSGWFMDFSSLAWSVYSPYEVYSVGPFATAAGQGPYTLGGQSALPVSIATSAVAFPPAGTRTFTPVLPIVDAYNRTAAWGLSVVQPVAASGGGCWILSGLIAPASSLYSAPAVQQALADLVRNCTTATPSATTAAVAPPTLPPCPCAPRGSPSSPVLPRVSTTPDHTHLVYPNGTLHLIVGMDSFRDVTVGLSPTSVARIFSEAAAAGSTTVRLYAWDPSTLPFFDCALDCATAEGVYVLLAVDGHSTDWTDRDALQAHAGAVARVVANETVVLGVDYVNEPYTPDIASMRVNASTNLTLGEKHGLNLTEYKAYGALLGAGSFSTFQNLASGVLPAPDGFGPFVASLNAVWAEWVGWYSDVFAAAAPETLRCVGMNTWEELLPSLYGASGTLGATLTLTCHHAYADTSFGYRNATVIGWVASVLDRIASGMRAQAGQVAVRPIALGETGCSNGEFVSGASSADIWGPPTGPVLDRYAAAAVDAAAHFLSLAHGHSGVTRWQVEDTPFPYAVSGMPWMGKPSPSTTFSFAQQGRFGAYYSAGGAELLLPKPTVTVSRGVRGLVGDLSAAGILVAGWTGTGTFSLADIDAAAANPLSTRVFYSAPGALFVADTDYNDTTALAFSAPPGSGVVGRVVSVLVRWGVGGRGEGGAATTPLCVTVSADALVSLAPASHFVPGEEAPGRGGSDVAGWTSSVVLEGQTWCPP